jgi:adenylate kinase
MALNINLFGQYASGKGTQRKLLMKKYNLGSLETGEIIRQEIEKKSQIGREMDVFIAKGQLVPDQYIIKMIDDFFDTHEESDGVVFDGLPRTLIQKDLFDAELAKYKKKVLNIEIVISDEVSLKRQLLRNEERADKDPKIAKARLAQFHKFVRPVIEKYAQEGNMLRVNGEDSVENIFAAICKIVDEYGHNQE